MAPHSLGTISTNGTNPVQLVASATMATKILFEATSPAAAKATVRLGTSSLSVGAGDPGKIADLTANHAFEAGRLLLETGENVNTLNVADYRIVAPFGIDGGMTVTYWA